MRKFIGATIIFAGAVTAGLTACTPDSTTVQSTYDPSRAIVSPAPNVDPRTPEQRYLDKLRDAGLSIADNDRAVLLGRMICQMYSNGNDDVTVQNAITLIVQNSRTAAGRGSEIVAISRNAFCPEVY